MFYMIWCILMICKSKPSRVLFIFNLTRLVPVRLFKKSLLEPNQAREQQHININVEESRSDPEKQQRSTLPDKPLHHHYTQGCFYTGAAGARAPVWVVGATTPGECRHGSPGEHGSFLSGNESIKPSVVLKVPWRCPSRLFDGFTVTADVL